MRSFLTYTLILCAMLANHSLPDAQRLCVRNIGPSKAPDIIRSKTSPDLQQPARGVVIEKVSIQSDPAQSYALYLPSSYTPEKKWPILYCFDPLARGSVPVEAFSCGG